MTVYAVFIEGIYRHECLGIFTSADLAKATADCAASKELDDHHTMSVVEFQLDAATPTNRADWNGPLYQEPPAMYAIKGQKR